jgi:hypothetical protein
MRLSRRQIHAAVIKPGFSRPCTPKFGRGHPPPSATYESSHRIPAAYAHPPSVVEDNPIACHSERSEESPHLTAQSVRKIMPRCFAGFTPREANGLSVADPKVVLVDRRPAGCSSSSSAEHSRALRERAAWSKCGSRRQAHPLRLQSRGQR